MIVVRNHGNLSYWLVFETVDDDGIENIGIATDAFSNLIENLQELVDVKLTINTIYTNACYIMFGDASYRETIKVAFHIWSNENGSH